MSISLVGIILIQSYFIYKNYEQNEKQFTINVNYVLDETIREIEKKEFKKYVSRFRNLIDSEVIIDTIAINNLIFIEDNPEKRETIIYKNGVIEENLLINNKNYKENILDIASKNDCWILSDEVYRGAELNGVESPSFYGRYEKTVVNAGLSKAYRLPGLRIGWTVGPKDYIKKAWAFHDYTSISIAYHSDWVASKILDSKRRKKILEGTKRHLNANLNTLVNWIDTLDGKLSMTSPQAGAPTMPVPTELSPLSSDPTFLGFSK